MSIRSDRDVVQVKETTAALIVRGAVFQRQRVGLGAAGVIGEVGSVDDGSTQTDTLALERQRGITIKAAVVSFAWTTSRST